MREIMAGKKTPVCLCLCNSYLTDQHGNVAQNPTNPATKQMENANIPSIRINLSTMVIRHQYSLCETPCVALHAQLPDV